MLVRLLVVIFSIPISVWAQRPSANFSMQSIACLNEQYQINNNSTNSTRYEWDFCLGDFTAIPTIENNISEGSGNSIKIVKDSLNYFGFAVNNTNLIRFSFGNGLDNTPLVTDLGDLGIISNSEGIDIIKEGNKWIGITGFGISGNGGNLVRIVWNDLNETPIAESLGNFGFNGRLTEIKLVKQDDEYIVVIPDYGGKKLVRINFGNSILNPASGAILISSNVLNSVSLPIAMSILRIDGEWICLLGSVVTKTISAFSLSSDILSEPVYLNSAVFNSWAYLSKLRLVKDGNYYVYVSTRNSVSHLVDLKSLLPTDTFQEITLSGLPLIYGLDVVKEGSKHYVFGASSKLQRLIFESPCTAPKSYSIEEFPIISYGQSGTTIISLKAYGNGEDDYIEEPVTISPSLAPQLSAQITGNCIASPISFNGQQLSGDITSWNWDFGDGVGTSSLQNAVYSYANVGEYQVKLSVTDVNGCNNLYIDTARVYEEPIPAFSIPPGNYCMNNNIAFTNTSTGETGSVVSWTWDFNGEGASTEKEPSFTFLTSGSKTVTLTSSIPGCANVTQQTINIEEAPTTAFSFNDTCNTKTTTFTDLTTGGNLTTWNWDFGDGSISADQNPTHEYALPGKYVVRLTVDNSLGCSTTKVDTVYNHAIPVVSFINDLACSSSLILFSDQSTVQDANIVAWEWDFGDGNTAAERNPEHLYGQPGDFTVQLKAYSQYGCVDSVETLISVVQGPEVNFIWDKACEGEVTTFTDNTNSSGIAITKWTWLINGTITNEQNPEYTFDTSDTYTVELSVTTSNLCAQTISKDIDIETPPETSFVYYESCTDDSVTFIDTTPSMITTREWRIDGSLEGAGRELKKSLSPNNYMVSLTTTTSAGCTNTDLQDIEITGSINAQFTRTTNYGAAPLTVQFTNQSNGSNSYLWQFGSPNDTSTEENPQFTFEEIGTYEVTLIVSGGENCSDTTVQTIEVVELYNNLSIDAITPLENGKMAITMSNNGSATYQELNSKLLFTLDNGAEITEGFSSILYPKNSINYVPKFSLGNSGNSQVLCVSLQYFDSQSTEILDKNCLNLNNQAVIADAYPNPAVDYINLSVVLPTPGSIKITLIDRNGAVLLSESYDSAVQGLNDYAIDSTPYRSGLYIIKIETKNEVKEMKVVIDK